MDLKKRPEETEAQFIWRLSLAKDNGIINLTWNQLGEIFNKELRDDESSWYDSSAYRKKYQSSKAMYDEVFSKMESNDIDEKIAELKKERTKLQTLNLERSRLDRNEARQELYYEYVGDACAALPWPNYRPLYSSIDGSVEYVVALADIHYGATFTSANNSYSPDICVERFEKLTNYLINFIESKSINKLHIVSLGDVIQGIIRISDLRINDSSIVKATVDVSRLIAKFLNQISAYCNIEYYHVPFANHTQIRVLNAKASEISDEDIEYIVGHHIRDLCSNNDRVNVNLADEHKPYIMLNVNNNKIMSLHGNIIKNQKNSIKDLNAIYGEDIDCLLLGHFHGGNQFTSFENKTSDAEVLIAPSFIGSDPYSDSLMVGGKAAVKVYGFDNKYGCTETYKCILN